MTYPATPLRVLYASDVIPGPGGGGTIIAERHLGDLSAHGAAVSVVVPGETGALQARQPSWKCLSLPPRRWWWPPFRPARASLANLHAACSRRALAGVTAKDAEVVVTICWGSTSWLAAEMAAAWRRPLVAIMHDWWAEVGGGDDGRIGAHVCKAARKILVVSEEMKAALAGFGPEKIDVLYPVPAHRTAPFVEWREEFSRVPVIAHVGALHPYHADYLAMLARQLAPLGGRLLVLCPSGNPVLATLRARINNLDCHDSFPTNAEAVSWISRQATALTVMYPKGSAASGAAPTGFPSRFVEFAQLGLPVLLAAPAGNPIRSWAKRNDWKAQLDPADEPAAHALVGALTDRRGWEELAAATRMAAKGDFDPGRLHRQFAAALQSTLAP